MKTATPDLFDINNEHSVRTPCSVRVTAGRYKFWETLDLLIYSVPERPKNPPTHESRVIRRPPLLKLLSSSLNLYWQKRPPLKAPAVIRQPL